MGRQDRTGQLANALPTLQQQERRPEAIVSIHVSKRVWRQSTQRGTAKLLLLAFAEYANDTGVCWPGAATLSKDIKESERYTRILIRQLLDSGELVARHGGGRGRKTVYGVVVGMNEQQRARLNTALEISVLQNTDTPENTETEISVLDENTDPEFPKTLISGDAAEVPNSAQEWAETAQNRNANHHGNHHESPPPPEPKTQPPRANAEGAEDGGGGVASAPSTGRWRDHPVYALLAQPKYGILSADRLMPLWQDAPPEQVQKLLETLYARHYSANAPNRIAGRMYRALEAGPGVLLKPPARAAPLPAPPPAPVPRTDTRAIAALLVEGRNGKPNAD